MQKFLENRNNRELNAFVCLFCRLQTGWSVKTGNLNTYKRPEAISEDEQEVIRRVIEKAEQLENVEQQRVG